MPAAILGEVGDSQVDGPRRPIDHHRFSPEPDLARSGGRQAEESLCQLGSSCADQAGQANDLAGTNGTG